MSQIELTPLITLKRGNLTPSPYRGRLGRGYFYFFKKSIVFIQTTTNKQQSTNKCVNIYLALKDISSGLFISRETDDRM
jgi:hypothetical protein